MAAILAEKAAASAAAERTVADRTVAESARSDAQRERAAAEASEASLAAALQAADAEKAALIDQLAQTTEVYEQAVLHMHMPTCVRSRAWLRCTDACYRRDVPRQCLVTGAFPHVPYEFTLSLLHVFGVSLGIRRVYE